MFTFSQESDTYIITVKNNPGTVLPGTGGSGTLMYTIAGLAMVLLAGVILVSRRKRKV